jgi:thiol-disulfide isomerase/thioredoxin
MHSVARNGSVAGLLILLLVPFSQIWAVTAGVRQVAQAVVGEPAPELALPPLRPGNDPVRLADFRGKIVYLDFWSSWCDPCRRAMPQLDALRQEFSRNDFEVLGVNVDLLAEDGRRFLEQVPVSYPMAADVGGRTAERFGVATLPALFVIDRAGVLRGAMSGGAVEEPGDLRETLAKLIDEQEVQ